MTLTGDKAFAVWLTGLPASGKSAIAKELARLLEDVRPVVLESDALRPILTPQPRYDRPERDRFYREIALLGAMLVREGIPVIIDATANLREYRDLGRREIPRFLEVFVDTPLDLCMSRDPKGIYRQGLRHGGNVPGLHVTYEPPLAPDLVVRGHGELPERAARAIVARLAMAGHVHIAETQDITKEIVMNGSKITARDCMIAGASIATGAALGLTMMYLYDPARGARRRRQILEKTHDLAEKVEEAVQDVKSAVLETVAHTHA